MSATIVIFLDTNIVLYTVDSDIAKSQKGGDTSEFLDDIK
jgi:hypothetical protein